MSAVATMFLCEYGDGLTPKELVLGVGTGPVVAALIGFCFAVYQPPEYSEQEVKIIKRNMGMDLAQA